MFNFLKKSRFILLLLISLLGSLLSGILSGTAPLNADSSLSAYILNAFAPAVASAQETSIGQWQVMPSNNQPSARHESTYVQLGGKLYLLGGRGVKPVQVFNPQTGNWTNLANTPMQIHHFQAVVLDNLIYVVAAMGGEYPNEMGLTQVYIFDPAANAWYAGPQIPAARQRGGAGVVVRNGKFYIVGGIQGGHGAHATAKLMFDEFDPATNTWTTLPNTPRARDHFQAALVGNRIYAAGGRNTATADFFDETTAQVDVYDFTTGQWTTLPSSGNIPTPRGGSMTAVLGDEVIVVGGEGHDQAYNKTEALNVNTNTWRTLGNLIRKRHGSGLAVCNNAIYVVAGAGDQGGSPELTNPEVFSFSSSPAPCPQTNIVPGTPSVPGSVNFGSVQTGNTSTQTITLSNANGNQGLIVKGISRSGNSDFSFSFPYTLPIVIPPGGSVPINVSFAPSSSSSKTGTLQIQYSTGSGSVSVSLSGTGGGSTSNHAVTSMTLVNATSDNDLFTLTDGATINLAELPSNALNIRANTTPNPTGSVAFLLSGQQSRNYKENSQPYALFGDSSGDYNNWTPALGSYTLTATPYTGSNGGGSVGTPLTIHFTVINEDSPTPSPTPPPTSTCGSGTLTQEGEQAALNGLFAIGNDAAASGGRYIHVPDGTSVSGSTLTSFAVFCFPVTNAGNYTLQATIYSNSGNSDSFVVNINSAAYIWDIPISNAYVIDPVSHRGGPDPLIFNLSAGQEFSVTVRLREDGARVDKITLQPSSSAPLVRVETEGIVTIDALAEPGAVQTLSGAITPDQTTLVWEHSPAATWYLVWAGTADFSQATHYEWHDAAALGCLEEYFCTLTLPGGIIEDPADYTWFVKAWGPGGYSVTDQDGWSAGSFTTP